LAKHRNRPVSCMEAGDFFAMAKRDLCENRIGGLPGWRVIKRLERLKERGKVRERMGENPNIFLS